MLVRGSRASLSSSTTSVRVNNVGSILVNFIIWPGNHDGGTGSIGNGMWVSAMVLSVASLDAVINKLDPLLAGEGVHETWR